MSIRAAAIVFALCSAVAGCGGSTTAGNTGSGGSAGNTGSGGSAGNTGSGGSAGNTGSGAGNTGSGGSAGNTGGGGTVVMGGSGGASAQSSLVGDWTGYIENYKFSDGSDALDLHITRGAPHVTGTIVFGNSPPPAPATNPDVGYPPGYITQLSTPIRLPFPGFVYTIVQASFDGTRLTFKVSVDELWSGWCAMQKAYVAPDGSVSGSCAPDWGGGSLSGQCFLTDPSTGQHVPWDCGKLELCWGPDAVCQCTTSGCTAKSDPVLSFDLNVNPPAADGSVDGINGLHNVHLKRK